MSNKNKPVLVRSDKAGLFFGRLISETYTVSGKVVLLKDSRRIFRWSGAATISQIAMEGIKDPKGSLIAMPVTLCEILPVCELIPLTEEVFEKLNNLLEWKAQSNNNNGPGTFEMSGSGENVNAGDQRNSGVATLPYNYAFGLPNNKNYTGELFMFLNGCGYGRGYGQGKADMTGKG